MIHITSLDDGLELFKALGSDIRIQILKILLENNQMSMNQLANELNISNGALTGHIKKLEECGLISASNDSSGHGNQKPRISVFILMTLWSAPGPLPVTMEMYAECLPLNGGLRTGINTVSSSF